ncbi:DoxX family protein [Mucilaginibacter sp. HMF5004]|uniref:DoxX family protein n=1 Tax=Mucilaginibacter rivuli TaxID=2857527 RepID=UPI001C5EED78|nr:DoxX family protein [Mucilaginibacter rivuli]MBW4890038.1 DoxX family protein [Mucilaginibacter rivuli]
MALFAQLGKYRNTGLLFMRVGLGVMFVLHGYPKLLGGPEKWEAIGSATKYAGIHFLPKAWGFLAACTETFGGFLLVLGLAFRPVCFLLLINMIVATLMHFGTGGGIEQAAHAIEDGVVFLGLLFIGPGSYSVDKK